MSSCGTAILEPMISGQHTNATARFATPAAIVDGSIVGRVFMSLWAMRLRSPESRATLWGRSTKDIFCVDDGFDMPRIRTTSNAAKVIQLSPIRDDAAVKDERQYVNGHQLAVDADVPVACGIFAAEPDPATGLGYLGDVIQQSIDQRSVEFRHRFGNCTAISKGETL